MARLSGLIAVVLLATAACGNTDGTLIVDDAWARPTPEGSGVAAFYAVIENGSDRDDVLLAASSARCVSALIHESTIDDGVMSMEEAEPEQLTVGAGGALTLGPNGLHVMCLGMEGPLVTGEVIPLILTFERAGDQAVEVVVEQR